MTQFLTHTPVWVWFLLATLCLIGYQQTKTRQLSVQRLVILPLMMLGLSLLSLKNSFGFQASVFALWLGSLLLSTWLLYSRHSSADGSYDEGSGLMNVRGSWLPLMLILGMFLTRYILNAGLAMHAELAQLLTFNLSIATAFGVLNGAFLGRVLGLIRPRKGHVFASA